MPADPLAARWKLDGTMPTDSGPVAYHVSRLPGGFAVMFVAGLLSGLLGIGSGAVKVLAMDQIMRIPFKVSTTTSNFMIGVTAAASAGIYYGRGYIDPALAMPVLLGVGLGAASPGAKVLVAGGRRPFATGFWTGRRGRGGGNDLQRTDAKNLSRTNCRSRNAKR